MTKQKITPHLWFDKEAVDAAKFYTQVFSILPGSSKITHTTTLHDTPSGDCDIVSFQLADYNFMSISAGPLFKINPSISFMVNFDPSQDKDARQHLDQIWDQLSQGGKALMPLDKYPFSDHYGWIEDQYGVSWQLILTNPQGEPRPRIIPSLLFVGDNCGKAEAATDFYLSVFQAAPQAEESKRGAIARYPAGMEPDKEGSIMFTDIMLASQWFAAMDSAHEHKFAFNEAISLMVNCQDQTEIDYYWDKLTADGGEESVCGWLKDKFGVSWQIVPKAMAEMMAKGTQQQIASVTQAFLQMKKFDLATLQKAYERS